MGILPSWISPDFVLDEPTNDVDADMLAAMEDLLDSWPGTLIVVSHDRYLLERVTDQQYAILGGGLRHVPGGVDEYLRLRATDAGLPQVERTSSADESEPRSAQEAGAGALSGAERRAAEKELAAVERKLERLQEQIRRDRDGLAALDQSDYQLLGVEMAKIVAFEDEVAALEERWLELSEHLG